MTNIRRNKISIKYLERISFVLPLVLVILIIRVLPGDLQARQREQQGKDQPAHKTATNRVKQRRWFDQFFNFRTKKSTDR